MIASMPVLSLTVPPFTVSLHRALLVVLLGVVQPSCAETAQSQALPANPAAQAAAACPIAAVPPRMDFGVVEPGTTVSATIKLLNPLDRPVRIVASTPSCTCTTVDMTGQTIPAKGYLEMPMSMKMSRAVGKKVAKVDLQFEGIRVPLSVQLDAETAYAVRANPPFIDALAPERMAGFFELIASDGQPFTVKSVDGKPAASADGTAMKPATRQVVKYDFGTPGLKRGVPHFLIVETDHPKCPVLDLRVRHETTRIAPILNFAEFRENLGTVENGKPVEFEIELKKAGSKRVDRVTANHKEFKAEIVGQKSDGDSVLVTVRMTPVGVPQGPFLFTCTFGAGQQASDLWIYGLRK
jgi:hypothetical protein